MRPEQVERWVSATRFGSFLAACEGDHERAVSLYTWNVQVSAAFFEVLHHVEVLLRNATDRQFLDTPPERIASTIPSPDFWITNDSVLTPEGIEQVDDVAMRLRRAGKTGLPVTRGRLIAGVSFGFWRALYDKPYATLWNSTLKDAFPNGSGKRGQVSEMLARIHPLRNRVAHHEAIFSLELADHHDRLLDFAGLMDEDARAYIDSQSRVPTLLAAKP